MNYIEKDLVRIAKRENNTKRNYLVVNQMQGKHIPTSPIGALKLFDCLADTFRDKYDVKKMLVVGFAETATAIGSEVAISLGAKYIQTTREVIPSVEYLFFSEEHSHATEQKLVKDDIDAVAAEIDRIVFVEDEVTTGNTILNIISILEKKYSNKFKYSVASILNGMSEESLKLYQEKAIDLFYLVKTDHSKYGEVADGFVCDGNYYDCIERSPKEYSEIRVEGLVNARRLVEAKDYHKGCDALCDTILETLGNIHNKRILVMGTEECMYPALYVGRKLEEEGNEVLSHSTTRSPIAVSCEADYPLHDRYQLRSLYDDERKTFIYDIGEYDNIIIVTDATNSESLGTTTLINAVAAKNEKILLIRWC